MLKPKRVVHMGRSRASWLILANRWVHLFVWWHALGADSIGFTFRVRDGDYWNHYRVIVFQRNSMAGRRQGGWGTRKHERVGRARPGRYIARPTLTLFEASRWRTRGMRDRHNLKAYVRLKIGPGGRVREDT